MTNISAFQQVRDFLRKCNLSEYYDKFIAEGFDQLQSLLDVTELDLIAMDVKRGHRRRLQREIATTKGIPPNIPLYVQRLEDSNAIVDHNIPQKIPYISSGATVESFQRSRLTPPESTDNGSTKRKYKRHPKRDKNAPVKPLSAYVMFAHKVREEYAGQNISFPDMAKIVGDRWKTVRPEVKEEIENEAAKLKEEYQSAMAVYKTTESWKKYQEYLKEFKEKHELISRDSNKLRNKRPKIELSPDSDNTTPSGYSSTRSTSVGYENGSGNVSSGSSNGGHNTKHQFLPVPYSNHGYQQSNSSSNPINYIPPYPHFNPTVPYGYRNNNGNNNTFVTPPSSNSHGTPVTTLADLYAKEDSNAGGDEQSQRGNGSSNGNGSGNGSSGSIGFGSSSIGRQTFEDSSDNSTTSSSNNTPPAVFMETEDNQNNQLQNSKR